MTSSPEGSDDRSDDEDRSDETEKPRSVRDGLPPARSGGPVPVRGSGAADAGGQRPVPVRKAMEAEREERQPVPVPSVRFERDGEEWIVRLEGRATAGFRGDRGAPIMFLTFARAEEPDDRILEKVAVGRSVEDLGPADLAVLMDDARPWRGDGPDDELFPETRKDRPSRR